MRIEPGTMLVASVAVSDGQFDRSVCLILDSDDNGALGVVVNAFAPYELDEVLPGWSPLCSYPARLFAGGPVSPQGAICLAVPTYASEEPPGWRPLFGRVGLLHLDTPTEIAVGAYTSLRIFAGYAGWSPGQLEGELAEGFWHPVPTRVEDIFDADPASLWRRVCRRQGGELGWLSSWTSTPELN